MKKFLIVLLVIMMMAGCTPEKKTPVFQVAVLTSSATDKAVLVASDSQGKEIFSADIEYPAEVYFGDEGVYYTANHKDYKSYIYDTHK